MSDRKAMAMRRNSEWCQGITPFLDATTLGKIETMFSSKRAGCSCPDMRDYITELYHQGRAAALPVYETADIDVTLSPSKRRISLKLNEYEIGQVEIIVGSRDKKKIAKSIAAFVCAGYRNTRGVIDCNGSREGIYI